MKLPNFLKRFSKQHKAEEEVTLTLLPKRGFEVLDEFKAHFEDGTVVKPGRKTTSSAGYDIAAIGDYHIAPNSKAIINTGLTAYMGSDEWLALFVRSGLAYADDLTLQNSVGVIDSDFYGKHIRILLRNEGTTPFEVKHGDRIAQAIFLPYLKADDDSEMEKAERNGGFGSTGVKSA
ncbi:dUTP diphosphatase [Priestia sp. YIM B13551]|uniref:dUTP diphosphatase n=1 Tax=Priestia sp. YIM B13551 TaxID=3366306 RepID=UPI00367256C6